MKRTVLLILVLLLLVDLADDGCFGEVKFNFSGPTAKICDTSSDHPDSGQTDFRLELASTDLSVFRYGHSNPVTLRVAPTLQIIHWCNLSSSGGIPL